MKLVYEDQQVCVVKHERAGMGGVEEKGGKKKQTPTDKIHTYTHLYYF